MSFLSSTWEKILRKLGQFGAVIPILADTVQMALKDGDVAKVAAALDRMEAIANRILLFVAKARQAIADNKLSLREGSDLALELEAIVDEADG